VETVVLRTPGNTGMANGPDKIANLYNYEVVNKTFKTQNINFRVKGGKASLIMVGKEALKLKSQQVQKGSFFIEMKGSEKTAITESLELEIITNGEVTDIVKTKFFYLPNQAQTSIIQ
jgi:hypothetical protein